MTGGRVLVSGLASSPLRRCLRPAVDWLESGAAPAADVTVLVGPPDAATWGRALAAGAPLVLVPATGPADPPPALAGALSAAGAVIALGEDEARRLAALHAPARLVVVPPDPPRPEGPARGLDPGEPDLPVTRRARAAWAAATGGPPPEDGPAVRWVGGRGAHPLAAALCAWADGAAVVTLPGCDGATALAAQGALACRSLLEVVEATRLLRSAPPLHAALLARGRRAHPPRDVPRVAEAALEGIACLA